jgi:hypothetical protein
LLYCTDVTITLAMQEPAYWQGKHDLAVEGNPVIRPIMLQGPVITLTVALAWATTFSLILLFWRHPWSVVMSFILTLFHACGASTWLLRYGAVGALVVLFLLAATAILWSWTLKRYEGMGT